MPGSYCSVDSCTTKTGSGIAFFHCPKEDGRCILWKNKLGFTGTHRYANISNEQSYNRIRICSKHFTNESFLTPEKKYLNYNAIPTLFLSEPLTTEFLDTAPVINNEKNTTLAKQKVAETQTDISVQTNTVSTQTNVSNVNVPFRTSRRKPFYKYHNSSRKRTKRSRIAREREAMKKAAIGAEEAVVEGLVEYPIMGSESPSIIKIEQLLNEIKEENDGYNHHNEKQSCKEIGMSIHEDNFEGKSEFDYLPEINYLSEKESKIQFGTACESTTGVCKSEGVDPNSTYYSDISKDSNVKLEETDHQNLSAMSDSYLNPTEGYEYDYNEEKLDISQPILNPIMPMANIKCDMQSLNGEKCVDGNLDLGTETLNGNGTTGDEENSEREYNTNHVQTNAKTASLAKLKLKGTSPSVTPINYCPKCEKQFTNKPSLDAHIMSIHNDDHSLLKIISSKIRYCPVCGKQFIYTSSLNSHIISVHKNAENVSTMISCKLHECPKCKMRYTVKFSLDAHIISCHNDDHNLMKTISSKLHDCPMCGKQFIHTSSLNSHIMTIHRNAYDLSTMASCKIRECPKCKKRFNNKVNLDKHIIVSHDDDDDLVKTVSSKIIHCPKCKKRFVKKTHLDGHILSSHNDDQDLMKTVSNRKTHQCPRCSKEFSYKSHLNSHVIRNHKHDKHSLETVSGKIEFKCPLCSEEFVYISTLNRHIINRHKSDEHLLKEAFSKSHDCPKCSKKFIYETELNRHIMRAHKNDEHLCNMTSSKYINCFKCKKRFRYKSYLDRHIINHHNDDHNN